MSGTAGFQVAAPNQHSDLMTLAAWFYDPHLRFESLKTA